MMKLLAILGLVALTTAYIIPDGDEPFENFEEDVHDRPVRSIDQDEQQQEYYLVPVEYFREKRSLQPGAPQIPQNDPDKGNHVEGDVTKQGKDTTATIKAQHGTDRYEVGGDWSKVVRGPSKAKPNWSVRGTYRW